MSKEKRKGIGDWLFDEALSVLMWLWYLILLVCAFGAGYWLAPHVTNGVNREAVGILGAIALVWFYEREEAQRRWDRLNEKIDRIMFPPPPGEW